MSFSLVFLLLSRQIQQKIHILACIKTSNYQHLSFIFRERVNTKRTTKWSKKVKMTKKKNWNLKLIKAENFSIAFFVAAILLSIRRICINLILAHSRDFALFLSIVNARPLYVFKPRTNSKDSHLLIVCDINLYNAGIRCCTQFQNRSKIISIY